MSARGELVFMVVLLSSVLAASIKESEENLFEQAECRGVCSLARDKASKTGVKVLRALSCYHCLNRRKSKTWRQERIKDRLYFLSTTFTKRHRRSLFLDPSLPTSSTALKPSDCVGASDDYSVPEIVMPSKVDVVFGKYENTSYWYANVSWTPIEDSSRHLYGTLLEIFVTPIRPEGACTVLRMNQTFLNINISFYGYSYPEPIYLLIHGLPYRKKEMAMTSYMPSIPTSSNLTTMTSTTASSTLPKPAECGVSSPDQSVDWTPNVVNVTFGQYENTSYWYVNVSWTPLNDSYGNWTDILVKLLVLTSTSDLVFARPVTCSVHPKNLTFLNINISSHHYEYPSPIFLKVVALPYSPKEDYAHIPQYDPPASIQSKPDIFPTTTPGKSTSDSDSFDSSSSSKRPATTTTDKCTVTVFVSMATGILAGIILGVVLTKYCLCRKKSSYYPPVICAWRSSCRPATAEFDRLNSTTSTATEISMVSLNKGRLI